MSPNKYYNQILYESLYMLKYQKFSAVLFFLIRLLRRAIIHLFYARNKYSFVSIKMILLIIKSKFNSEKFMAKE